MSDRIVHMIDSPGWERERVELSGIAPGPDLAAALAAGVDGIETLDLSQASRGQLVDLALAAEKVKAWAAAVQAKATAALVEQFETAHEAVCARDRHLAHEQAVEATSLSLSLALGISLRAADKKLTLALGLDAHPDLADALSAGRIDEAQAGVIYDHAAALPQAQATRLVQSVVTDPATGPAGADVLVKELRDGSATVWSIPAHQLRPILTRAVADLAPETLQDAPRSPSGAGTSRTTPEHRPARRAGPARPGRTAGRHLRPPGPPGPHRPQRRRPRNPGPAPLRPRRRPPHRRRLRPDPRPQDQRDQPRPATGHAKKRRRLRSRAGATLINVTVADRTLLGLDNQPAVLHTPTGDVPIPAELARALAHDPEQATWRRILCDPATGTATEVSTGYRPAPRIAQFCAVRDGHTTRFPTSAARTLELDHIHEYNHTAPATGGADHPGQPGRRRQTRPPSQNRPHPPRHRRRQQRAHLHHRHRPHLHLQAPPIPRTPNTRTSHRETTRQRRPAVLTEQVSASSRPCRAGFGRPARRP